MTTGVILERLKARGIRLQRSGESLLAIPKAALTDELRALIRDHKAELLNAVEGRHELDDSPESVAQPEALAIHAGCFACDGCRNVKMSAEYRDFGRRFFWWVCGKGHQIIEAGYRGERILLAPSSCNDYDPTVKH